MIFIAWVISTILSSKVFNPKCAMLAIKMQCQYNLIQNSQAVKKECGLQKGYGEKRCEIQGGGQEMAVMVG